MELVGLDHVQLAMPFGEEDAARRFYAGILGLTEVAKPAALSGRGGCWFVGTSTHVHLGVEPEFRPAAKAHPAFLVPDIEKARQSLAQAGIEIVDEDSLDVERFYANDPFGNRLEFVAVSDRGFSDPAVARDLRSADRTS